MTLYPLDAGHLIEISCRTGFVADAKPNSDEASGKPDPIKSQLGLLREILPSHER